MENSWEEISLALRSKSKIESKSSGTALVTCVAYREGTNAVGGTLSNSALLTVTGLCKHDWRFSELQY